MPGRIGKGAKPNRFVPVKTGGTVARSSKIGLQDCQLIKQPNSLGFNLKGVFATQKNLLTYCAVQYK